MLLAFLADLAARPRPLTGDQIAKVQGPGGIWSISLRKKTSGSGWQWAICAPPDWPRTGDRGKFYCPAAVERAILYAEAPAKLREPLAALFVQTRWRLLRALRAQTAQKEAREQRLALQAKIAELLARKQVLLAEEDTRAGQTGASLHALAASCNALAVFTEMHPGLQLCVSAPPLHTKSRPLVELIVEETALTRDALRTHATAFLAAHPDEPDAYVWKSVLKNMHFPLLAAVACLPGGLRAVTTDVTYFVDTPPTISLVHKALLEKKFSGEWPRHVQNMIESRPVKAYDLYLDKYKTTYAGTLVVAKFLVRVMGVLYPCISIESICTVRDSQGYGTFLFALAKQLLWVDTDAKEGYIFAQCLGTAFWNDLLDVSVVARCLVAQMNYVYKDYHVEEECTMRASKFHVDQEADDSPKKKVSRVDWGDVLSRTPTPPLDDVQAEPLL
jgi:hypothetical protein